MCEESSRGDDTHEVVPAEFLNEVGQVEESECACVQSDSVDGVWLDHEGRALQRRDHGRRGDQIPAIVCRGGDTVSKACTINCTATVRPVYLADKHNRYTCGSTLASGLGSRAFRLTASLKR